MNEANHSKGGCRAHRGAGKEERVAKAMDARSTNRLGGVGTLEAQIKCSWSTRPTSAHIPISQSPMNMERPTAGNWPTL
eukprot:scaffold48978_cov33-Tisochrysis_lutea.AAC.3